MKSLSFVSAFRGIQIHRLMPLQWLKRRMTRRVLSDEELRRLWQHQEHLAKLAQERHESLLRLGVLHRPF